MIKMLVMTVDLKQLLQRHQAIHQSFTFFHLSAPVLFLFGFLFSFFLLMDLKFLAKLALCKEIEFSYTLGL